MDKTEQILCEHGVHCKVLFFQRSRLLSAKRLCLLCRVGGLPQLHPLPSPNPCLFLLIVLSSNSTLREKSIACLPRSVKQGQGPSQPNLSCLFSKEKLVEGGWGFFCFSILNLSLLLFLRCHIGSLPDIHLPSNILHSNHA